jgi:hypothetical protein
MTQPDQLLDEEDAMRNPLRLIFYRAAENHLGTIYRAGYLHRLVPPRRFPPRFLIPWIDRPGPEVDMGLRTAEVVMVEKYTKDGYPFDLTVKVFYRIDFSHPDIDRGFLVKALRFSDLEWGGIIRTNVIELCNLKIFPNLVSSEMRSERAQCGLKQDLSRSLAERCRSFGLVIHPDYGVSIQRLDMNERIRPAFDDGLRAGHEARAAITRIQPFVELVKMALPDASKALIWTVIAESVRNGVVPDLTTEYGRQMFVELVHSRVSDGRQATTASDGS